MNWKGFWKKPLSLSRYYPSVC